MLTVEPGHLAYFMLHIYVPLVHILLLTLLCSLQADCGCSSSFPDAAMKSSALASVTALLRSPPNR